VIRYALLSVLGVALAAHAGISCPPDSNNKNNPNSCEPSTKGDPVKTFSGVSNEPSDDLKSPGTVRPFVFTRYFQSTDDLSAYTTFLGGNAADVIFVPKMFGTSRTNVNAVPVRADRGQLKAVVPD
jgi:hypothetical protein